MVVRINIKDEDYWKLKEIAESQARTVPSLLRQGYKIILKEEKDNAKTN